MDITVNSPKEKVNAPKAIFYLIFAVYVILFIITSVFHEPWLDEAQGWMIARDASYHDMFLYLPHYEGHPPFWWLVLSVPAKFGLPYEASLSAVMLVTYCVSTYLILFRSPFSKALKLILPFSYYLFFEYGIVSRPYGLLTLGMLLMACTYNQRNEKPFRYIFSCMLTCSMSAYGIALCGGLSVLWCVQIVIQYKKDILKFIGTRRFFALLLLLIFAISEILMVMPYPDTFTIDNEPMTAARLLSSIYYMFFMLPADSLLIGAGMGLSTLLKYNIFPMYDRIVLTFLSLIIWYAVIMICKKAEKLRELIVVYPFFAVFSVFIYLKPHHEGILPLFMIFLLWISFECMPQNDIVPEKSNTAAQLTNTRTMTMIICGVFAINTLWSVYAVIIDLTKDYCYGRAVADYIKENDFDTLSIMSSWYDLSDAAAESGSIVSTSKQHKAVTISPYFDHNIFFNFNSGNEGYIIHTMDEAINQRDYQEWSETIPDILVGEPDLGRVYTNIRSNDYILIKTFEFNKIFKLSAHSDFISIYMRRDLFDDYPQIQPQNEADLELINQNN